MKTAVEGHYRRSSGSKRKSSKGLFDDIVLYEARDCISRQKLISHFGVDCAIRTGAGSRLKVENIYGGSHADVSTRRRKSDSSVHHWSQDLNSPLLNDNINTPLMNENYSSSSSSNYGYGHRRNNDSLDRIVQPIMVQKLYDFFGNDAAIDIPFEEIEKNGIGYLIQSSVPLAYFIQYLLIHDNPEIMFFFMDVIKFEETIYPDNNSSLAASQNILTNYLCINSPLECRVSSKTRCHCIKAIKAGQRRCFKASKQELLPVLERQFDDFKNSKKYAELKINFAHLNAYPESNRLELIQELLSTTNRKYPIETAETLQRANRNKAVLLKIQEFCRNKLSNNNVYHNNYNRNSKQQK
ncbi:hypothetical protein H8356DRAFT_948495 [Neocallimastix lanati (nom. inval.)]|jgi:hypothetical protein|uniref:RGS domain-containing protein n=1 Tax=Neocallimastix californiae TaxID=1754190 RepID=A0A1Y2BZ79_9FUNG|nr:hypothetical protein H8356DRAFT_948495 [Neocallimastix sp. JGI-2020a]ORY40068.1 hypothetical protein LY90DRAFT_510527 [Neocallimastix californiae]|eukprot:ORY40068.1 hypothetical protein LY90DRAFT_510527 [Neocallimastix californiae]